jgi:hypothetical protein
MSTVAEIENAIELLPAVEREALESRLLARRFGLDALDQDERAELLSSLDAAEREIDAGRVHSAGPCTHGLAGSFLDAQQCGRPIIRHTRAGERYLDRALSRLVAAFQMEPPAASGSTRKGRHESSL